MSVSEESFKHKDSNRGELSNHFKGGKVQYSSRSIRYQ